MFAKLKVLWHGVARLLPASREIPQNRRFNAAVNAVMASYTYEHITDAQRLSVDAAVEPLMQRAGYAGQETLAFLAAPIDLQLAIWAAAMKRLSIEPALPGERWRDVNNPFEQDIYDDEDEDRALSYLRLRHGLLLNQESTNESGVHEAFDKR
jgi:hypothetical protein